MKFCEGVVGGLTACAAYRAAYPKSSPASVDSSASKLARIDKVKAEIVRLRALAVEKAGGAVMTLLRIRLELAAIAQCKTGILNGSKILTSDRIAAMKLDAALAGIGKEVESTCSLQDAIGQMLRRVMIK